MYHGWNSGWAGAGYAFGFPWGSVVMGLLMLALVALAVTTLLRMGRARGKDLHGSRLQGIDILIERYARGEIDAETFRAMKAELEAKD